MDAAQMARTEFDDDVENPHGGANIATDMVKICREGVKDSTPIRFSNCAGNELRDLPYRCSSILAFINKGF
ncbi:hypothetical protein HT118_21665 [Escherichia coli]|nr:hypothetical protein [Escherichia coli]